MKTITQKQNLEITVEDARLLFPALEQAAHLEAGRGNPEGSARLWSLFQAIEKLHFYRPVETILSESEMAQLAGK